MYRIHFYNNFIDEEFKKRQQICFYFHCEIHCYSNKKCLPMTILHIEVHAYNVLYSHIPFY